MKKNMGTIDKVVRLIGDCDRCFVLHQRNFWHFGNCSGHLGNYFCLNKRH